MRIRKYLEWFFGLAGLILFANLVRAFFIRGASLSAIKAQAASDDVGLALFYLLLAVGLWLMLRYAPSILSRKGLVNTLLTFGAVALALVLFELILLPFNLVFNSATVGHFDFQAMQKLAKNHPELKHTWDSKVHWMIKDQQLGYRPMTGGEYTYDLHGAQQNEYSPESKPPGVVRVLFTGDSIAALGFLNRSIRELNPRKNYEYWNTGVYGYSTWQEVRYFERYGRKLKPDLVILEFCLNDWDGTPVILKDETGKTLIANLYLGTEHFNYWLFKHSTIYRVWLSLKASFTGRAGLKDDVKKELARLQQYGRENGFALRVVIYPELEKLKKWPEKFLRQRQDIREILEKLGIRYYDATDLLDQALAHQPRHWARLTPDDHFHPSAAFSRLIAKALLKEGFLDPSDGGRPQKP